MTDPTSTAPRLDAARHWDFAAALALGVCVGVAVRGLDWLWFNSSEQLSGMNHAMLILVMVIGPLLHPLVVLLPGWLAGWVRPVNSVATGMAVAAIVQLLMTAWELLQKQGLYVSSALPGMLAAVVGTTLFGGAAGGAAQLIRNAGGLTAYLDNGVPPRAAAASAPAAPGSSAAMVAAAPASQPAALHIAASIGYFVTGVIGCFGGAVTLALLTGDSSGSLSTLLRIGLLSLGVLLVLMIGAYFLLRRRPVAIYVAMGAFLVLAASVTAVLWI